MFSLTSSVKKKPTTLLTKFDEWGDEWYSGPRNRLPYLGPAKMKAALLTTSDNINYYQYGCIVSDGTRNGNKPSPWMMNYMDSPGHIWYWINENDCDASREKGMVFIHPSLN